MSGTRNRGRKKPLLVIILGLATLVAFYFFLHSSVFTIDRINATGNKAVAASEIIELSGIKKGQNLFDFKPKAVERAVNIIPRIKEARVVRHLPGGVEIIVAERKPWAVVVGDKQLLVVDEEGVCLEKKDGFQPEGFPIVTLDQPVSGINEGAKVCPEAIATVRKLATALPSAINGNVSEFHCASDGQVLLYTLEGIEIRFGSLERMQEKTQILQQALQLGKQEGQALKYIDLRYEGQPVISYRQMR